MPIEVKELTMRVMTDPVTVEPMPNYLHLEGTKQFYVAIDKEEWKFETLIDLYETIGIHTADHLNFSLLFFGISRDHADDYLLQYE